MRRLAALTLASALCGPRGLADPPVSPAHTLTRQEIAARLERVGKDPVLLLEVAALADATEARRLRDQVRELLQNPPQDPLGLVRRLAPALERSATTDAELKEVLGNPRMVARQILYQRAIEQWHYVTPLPLIAIFDWPRGQDRRLRTILPDSERKS